MKSVLPLEKAFYLFLILGENIPAVFLKYFKQADAQYAAGDDFADSHGEHEIRDSALKSVGVGQNKGDDNRICDNRGKGGEEDFGCPGLSVGFCASAEKVGAKRAQKSSQASEEYIPGNGACEKVGQQASHKQPRYGSRSEEG